jgi:phospholipid transport system substrate-binding protein
MTPPASKIRNSLAVAALALAALTAPARTAVAAVPDDRSPAGVVEQTSSRVIEILADKNASADDKRRRIQDVVYANLDFETLSRLVLARNWSRFTDAQRQKFIDEFKAHLSMTYGRNVENYRNEKVTIVGSREEAKGDWTVKTKILRGGPGDINVDYRLRQRDGAWRIIDVIVEGVSLVSNFRSQFQDVVSSGGPDRLIALLEEKNAKGEPLKAPQAQ